MADTSAVFRNNKHFVGLSLPPAQHKRVLHSLFGSLCCSDLLQMGSGQQQPLPGSASGPHSAIRPVRGAMPGQAFSAARHSVRAAHPGQPFGQRPSAQGFQPQAGRPGMAGVTLPQPMVNTLLAMHAACTMHDEGLPSRAAPSAAVQCGYVAPLMCLAVCAFAYTGRGDVINRYECLMVLWGAETWRIPAAVPGLPGAWSGTAPAHAEATAASAARYQRPTLGHTNLLTLLMQSSLSVLFLLLPVPAEMRALHVAAGFQTLASLSLRRCSAHKQARSPWAAGPARLPAPGSHAANAPGTTSITPASIRPDPPTRTCGKGWPHWNLLAFARWASLKHLPSKSSKKAAVEGGCVRVSRW